MPATSATSAATSTPRRARGAAGWPGTSVVAYTPSIAMASHVGECETRFDDQYRATGLRHSIGTVATRAA